MSASPLSIDQAAARQSGQTEPSQKSRIAPAGLVARSIAIGMLTVTPWLFGGVQAGVQVWLFVGAAAALACWLIKCLDDRSANTVPPLAVVPLICALGLAVFQLVPLGAKTHAFFSPRGAELRSELIPRQSSPDGSVAEKLGVAEEVDREPLSLYPASTRRDLALLVLAVGMFLVGSGFFQTPLAQIWLCTVIAANGAALAFFGLVQQLSWNGLLYWSVPLSGGGGPFGPFVNRNNAGGFLGLCLAGAAGMTIWAVGRPGSRRPEANRARSRRSGQLSPRAQQPWWRSLARLNALCITALGLVAFILAGMLCSLSRGTLIATIGATVFTTLVVLWVRRQRPRLWWLGLGVTAGLALVGWVGMTDAVQGRLATMLDQQTLSQARIPHWRDGLQAVPDFWRAGSGLGTYRYLYGLYQQRLDELWYYHAENQYLEALVEGGIVGLSLILLTIGLVGMAAWRLLRHDPDPRGSAFGVAALFALSGQTIHACFDFALYIPANMILFALLCGAVSGRAAVLARTARSPGPHGWSWFRCPATLLAASALAAAIWGVLEIRRVAAVETALKSTCAAQTPEGATPDELRSGVQRLAIVLERQPDDAEAQYRAAELWIQLYRVRAYEQLHKENTSAADDQRLWQLTLPAVLHRRAHELSREGLQPELERLRSEPVVRDHLGPALRHLVLARRACPLLPQVHLATAALGVLAVDPSADLLPLARVRQVAPADPDLLYQCGVFELDAGRWELACESWRRSLTLSPRYLDAILALAGPRMAQPPTIERLLPDSPALLLQLARERYRGSEQTEVRRGLVQRAESLIAQGRWPEAERCYLLGAACALRELYPQAIAHYSRAVALRVRETSWRYELALALQRQGLLGDAQEQARLCVRMDPDKPAYRTLLEEINHVRLTQSSRSPK